MKKKLSILFGIFILSTSLFATGFQLSLPSTNLPESETVSGLRLVLFHGETSDVSGLDLALIGLSDTDNFKGLQLGFLGATRVKNSFTGVAWSLFNLQYGQSKGVNLGVYNQVQNLNGLNWGFVNNAKNDSTANFGFVNYIQGSDTLNWGFVNKTMGHSHVDLGFVNIADSSFFQLGFVNVVNRIDGLQIGLVNCAKNGVYPILPFVNFKKSF